MTAKLSIGGMEALRVAFVRSVHHQQCSENTIKYRRSMGHRGRQQTAANKNKNHTNVSHSQQKSLRMGGET